MNPKIGVLILMFMGIAIGNTTPKSNRIDKQLLYAAWTSHGGNFEFVISEKTILYEFDMQERPYKLEGNILVIDFQDASLGVQRKEILRLTKEELELRDVRWKDSATIFKHVP